MKNKHLMFSTMLVIALAMAFSLMSSCMAAETGTREFLWQEEFQNPLDEYRVFHMWHRLDDKRLTDNYETIINTMYDYGFRGIVTNNAWDENYLKDSSNYALMNTVIDLAKEMGMTVWLYDEHGWPSGTADGQTLDGYPEYEAVGVGLLSGEYTDTAEFTLPEAFQKVVYAEMIRDGKKTPVSFDPGGRAIKVSESGTFTLNVYAQKTAFEGSHAELNGFRPLRYPNLLNREAIKRFIDLVYGGYKKHVPDIGNKVQAIFTDEPSLMTHYMNTPEKYPYFIVPVCLK